MYKYSDKYAALKEELAQTEKNIYSTLDKISKLNILLSPIEQVEPAWYIVQNIAAMCSRITVQLDKLSCHEPIDQTVSSDSPDEDMLALLECIRKSGKSAAEIMELLNKD